MQTAQGATQPVAHGKTNLETITAAHAGTTSSLIRISLACFTELNPCTFKRAFRATQIDENMGLIATSMESAKSTPT